MQYLPHSIGTLHGYQPAYRKKLFQYRQSYHLARPYGLSAGSESAEPFETVPTASYLATSPLFAPLLDSMVGYIDFSPVGQPENRDPIVGMFREKTHFGRAVIEDVLTDMSTRYDMMNRAVQTLDYQICAVDSAILQLPYFQAGIDKDLDKLKMTLEAKAMDFEQQKMEERVDGWKDITRLKTDLFEVLKEYAGNQASSSFLNTDGGGTHY